MRVVTKPFGAIDVDDRQRIVFPDGILGFEDLKDYVLLDAAQPPFYWLQSLDRTEIAFVLIEPHVFRPDYDAEVDREELAEIGIAEGDDPILVEQQLCAALPKARWTRASDTLILHGRRICRPKPLCDRCVARDDCDYYRLEIARAPRRSKSIRAARR